MAEGGAGVVIHVPGRFCADPDQAGLLLDFPHNGTELGGATEIVVNVDELRHDVPAQEYGGEIVEVIRSAKKVAIGALLAGFDPDALTKLFESATTSTKTGKPEIEIPGSKRKGFKGSDQAFRLLFSPDDTEQHPAILLHRAVPLLGEAARLQLSIGREFGVPAMFRGLRDANARLASVKMLEDMVI